MEFHIIVCIKSVVLEAPGGKAIRTPETCALNPFDRPVIETALSIREEAGGLVTVLSMGPGAASIGICEALAMGADRGILICDPLLAGSDTLVTSTVLSAGIRKLPPYDLLLFGSRTSDSATGQVGPQTAVSLDIPMVAGVTSIRRNGSVLTVDRRYDEFIETLECSLPAALTIHPSACAPQDVSLFGIEAAFGDMSIDIWPLEKLGLSAGQVGEAGSPTRIISLKQIQRKRTCEFISGSSEEQAEKLIHSLQDSGLIG